MRGWAGFPRSRPCHDGSTRLCFRPNQARGEFRHVAKPVGPSLAQSSQSLGWKATGQGQQPDRADCGTGGEIIDASGVFEETPKGCNQGSGLGRLHISPSLVKTGNGGAAGGRERRWEENACGNGKLWVQTRSEHQGFAFRAAKSGLRSVWLSDQSLTTNCQRCLFSFY